MALSQVVIPGDGVTTLLTVDFALGFITPDHVTCRVGDEVDGAGNPVYRTFTFQSSTLVQVDGTPAAVGQDYVFVRVVPKEELLVNWEDGDPITGDNLDKMQEQLMEATHEALDLGERAVKVAPGTAGPEIDMAGASTGDVLIVDADGKLVASAGPAGTGDMQRTAYDPQGINADAFARENHTGTQPMSSISGLEPALDAKVGTTGDRMTGELELYTAEDAASVTAVQGRMLPKLGQYLSYIASRTYTALATFFSQPVLTLEATEIHSASARGTKGSLWATKTGTGTSSRRLTWDDTGIRGIIAGTYEHLVTMPESWGVSTANAAAVNDAAIADMLANVNTQKRIDGNRQTYTVTALPDMTRFKHIAFKVGSIIYTSRDFWRGVTTSKISNGMLYTAWAQDSAYPIENQIRVWGMEKESHTDGTERIVLFASDDNGSSFAAGEYLTPEADGRSVWSAGLWGNDEILIVRVGAGGLDVAPFTYEKWHRTFNFGAGTSDYNKPWTVTPITFPVPAGFTGQPSMVHSWAIGHSNSIVVGAHWGAGAAVFRSTDGGVTWTDHVLAVGTANEEPTVKYDAATQRYYGFLRNGSSGGNPKYWVSGVNDLSSASISVYTAPAGTFGALGMQASPIPFQIVNGRIHAFGSYRSGTFEGVTDELTSAFYMDLPLSTGNVWADATTKIYRLGTIAHREVGGASACGVGSVVYLDDKIHLYYGMEERTGTTNGFNRIANLYQTVIPLEERTGIYDFRDTLADNRASGSPLRKLPENAGWSVYTDDAAGNSPARVGGCPNFARYASTLTIAAGVLTITSKHGYYVIDTEGAAATDDLDKISVAGRLIGDCIVLQTASAARDVTVKHNSVAGVEGSIWLNGQTDKLLSSGVDNIILTLALSGSTKIWKQLSFNDLTV